MLLASFSHMYGQKPDFAQDNLYVVSGSRFISNENDISASTKVFCTGKYISIVIEVKDDVVKNMSDSYFTDHVELWFALPRSAYAGNFEYAMHPNYVYYQEGGNGRMWNEGTPRFFSVYSEYSSEVNLRDFVRGYDYPKLANFRTTNSKLKVPRPEKLRKGRAYYGIVHYGLYPDQRSPVLYDKNNYKLVESAVNHKMGNIAGGLKYVAERTDEGYIINARISTRALGFVTFPKMEQIRLMVDVVDTDYGGRRDTTLLSTSSERVKGVPATFNRVEFQRPLRTNYSDVPDITFNKIGVQPVYMYTRSDWQPTYVDTDALVYGYESVSDSLIEVKFSPLPMEYKTNRSGGFPSEVLALNYEYVNTIRNQLEYILVNGFVFKSEQVKESLGGEDTVRNSVFRFPDGVPGVILKDNLTVNPFGWGECGKCVEEIISIHRVASEGPREILSIFQGDGPNPYCQVQDLSFDDYYVAQLDWIDKGRLLVLNLRSWKSRARKRIKVTWDGDGTDVRVVLVP